MQLAFRKTNPCSRIRAYACSKPPVRRIELFPSFGIRLFPFPFTLFRYINPKRRKNFTKRRLTKFFRRFISPKRRLRRRLMARCFFKIANDIYIADFQPSKRKQYYMQSHKTNTISTKHEFNSWQRLYKVGL